MGSINLRNWDAMGLTVELSGVWPTQQLAVHEKARGRTSAEAHC
ncbi:hypothetical protein BH24GEM2_BH24GEM2_09810 [soil metagenome]|jgi:hypothetical protein